MKLAELANTGRSPQLPLSVDLPAGQLQLLEWLRVLPGQRYVARAEWQGRAVFAKLMVGSRAERHFQRERDGAVLLRTQQMATPELLAEGYEPEQGGWLLFEFLEGAESLGAAWQAVEREPLLSNAQQGVLGEALGEIGRLHARGLWQSDLHLDNLLRYDGQLYLVDGGGVRAQEPGQPLPRELVLQNLGLFFAQLPAALEPFIEELLVHYLLVNGEHALPMEALSREVTKVRRWRQRDYLDKTGRDCTLFSVRRGASGLLAMRREEEPRLQSLLADLEHGMAGGSFLKKGGSATVALVEVDGHPLVIKRYNIKGLGHWLQRCWRPTRAWHSWVEGNRLDFLGIATPKPLAVLEHRWLGLRGRSYLITEYAGGQDIISHFQPYLAEPPPESELTALRQLFDSLLRERISHGDMKGTNLLWQGGRWLLIDLDGLRHHQSERAFVHAFAKDRARFLRNWPADSALYRLLDECLPRTA